MMVDRNKRRREKRFEWDIGDLDFFDAAGNPIDLEKRAKEKEKLTGKDVLPQPPEEEAGEEEEEET